MNALHVTLASRYAQAFMNIFAATMGDADLDSLTRCAQFLSTKKELLFFLNIPLIDTAHKQQMIDQICNDYNLSGGYNKLCMLLIEHQRSLLLPMIFTMIKNSYMKLHSMHTFTVTSPCELLDAEKNEIQKFLEKKLQGSASCSYQVDGSLIAGVRIASQTLLWEDSIKKRLTKFKNALRR